MAYAIKVTANVEPLDGLPASDAEATELANIIASALDGLHDNHGWSAMGYTISVTDDTAGVDVTATDHD